VSQVNTKKLSYNNWWYKVTNYFHEAGYMLLYKSHKFDSEMLHNFFYTYITFWILSILYEKVILKYSEISSTGFGLPYQHILLYLN